MQALRLWLAGEFEYLRQEEAGVSGVVAGAVDFAVLVRDVAGVGGMGGNGGVGRRVLRVLHGGGP